MGNKLMRKMVAVFVAAAMILTSGIGVFAAGSPAVGQVSNESVESYADYSSRTMTVTCATVANANKYDVYLNGVLAGTSTTPAVSLAGLTAGATYDIVVVASNSSSQSTSVVINKTTSKRWFKTMKIKKVKKGKKKATVTWKKVKGATGYQIAYSKDGKTWKYKFIKGGKKTKATIKKLSKGKWYFKVRPVKGNYLGILSGTKSCKVKK